MKTKVKKSPKRPSGSMIIEAATSDSPVSAFIALFKSPDGKPWPAEDAAILERIKKTQER
jgi:hypothetical protein